MRFHRGEVGAFPACRCALYGEWSAYFDYGYAAHAVWGGDGANCVARYCVVDCHIYCLFLNVMQNYKIASAMARISTLGNIACVVSNAHRV